MAADLRDKFAPPRDQGNRGTCVAFAMTAAHEVHRNVGEHLSEEFLYWGSKQWDGLGGRPGTTVEAALNVLASIGQADEGCWPYEPNRDDSLGLGVPTHEALTDAATRIWTTVRPLPLTISAVVETLNAGAPVVLVTWVFQSWFRAPAALISLPSSTDARVGRHAVLLTGYREPLASPTIVFRNSWGRSWGDDGYGYMAHDYLMAHGIATWTTASP